MTVQRKKLHQLFFPLFFETLFMMLAGMVDTLMLSSEGDYAVGAVGTANTYISLFIIMFSIISSGMVAVMTQYIGAKRPGVAHQALKLGLMQAAQELADSKKKRWDVSETKRSDAEQTRKETEEALKEKDIVKNRAEAAIKAAEQNLIEGIADETALLQKIREINNSTFPQGKASKTIVNAGQTPQKMLLLTKKARICVFCRKQPRFGEESGEEDANERGL